MSGLRSRRVGLNLGLILVVLCGAGVIIGPLISNSEAGVAVGPHTCGVIIKYITARVILYLRHSAPSTQHSQRSKDRNVRIENHFLCSDGESGCTQPRGLPQW